MIRRLLVVWLALCGLLFVQQSKAWWQSIQQVAVTTGGGSVTSDAQGSLSLIAGSSSTNYTGLTAGSANGLLALITLKQPQTVSSAVWDSGASNQALTFIGAIDNGVGDARLEIWGFVGAVTAGNKTLAVTFSASTVNWIQASTFSGVNASLASAFPNFTSNTAVNTTVNISVTSGSGHFVGALSAGGITANAVSITATQLYLNNSGAFGVLGAQVNGSGSVNVTATYDAADALTIAGVDVAP